MIKSSMSHVKDFFLRTMVYALRHAARLTNYAASSINKDNAKRSNNISDTNLHDFAHNIILTQVPIWSINLQALSRQAIDNHSLLELLGGEIALLSNFEISLLRSGRTHKYFGSR